MITPDEILKLPTGHCILINPAYCTKTEANVPLKLPVKILPAELKKEADSRAGFERLHQALIKRAQARGVVTISSHDIRVREASVDQLLPLPNKGGGQPGTARPGATNNALLTQQAQQNDQAQFDQIIDDQPGIISAAQIDADLLADPPF